MDIQDLKYYLEDHWQVILVLFLCVSFVGIAGIAYASITAPGEIVSPTPLPSPAITPIPSVVTSVTPTPRPMPPIPVNESTGLPMSYDEYIRWVTDYYYDTNSTSPVPSGTPVFLDPMSYTAYLKWLDATKTGDYSPNPGYVPGHPETANGSIIYLPTPIPCPTPTPTPSVDPFTRERHKTVDNVQLPPPDKEASVAGILAWDQEHTRGLYPYYSKGDHAVILLRFVNNYCPQEIKNPEITLVVKKSVLGQYIIVQQAKWIEPVTIPGADVDDYYGHIENELPYFTTLYEWDIPAMISQGPYTVDTAGNYIIEVTVMANDVQACWFSKQIAIL